MSGPACHEPVQSLRPRCPGTRDHPVPARRDQRWPAASPFCKLGRAEDPAFTIKVLTVTAAWPGATAQEMQDLVAEPLEKRLQELRWYDRVETFTRPGLAFMTLA